MAKLSDQQRRLLTEEEEQRRRDTETADRLNREYEQSRRGEVGRPVRVRPWSLCHDLGQILGRIDEQPDLVLEFSDIACQPVVNAVL